MHIPKRQRNEFASCEDVKSLPIKISCDGEEKQSIDRSIGEEEYSQQVVISTTGKMMMMQVP